MGTFRAPKKVHGKAQFAGNGRALAKSCNAAVGLFRGSLRASCQGAICVVAWACHSPLCLRPRAWQLAPWQLAESANKSEALHWPIRPRIMLAGVSIRRVTALATAVPSFPSPAARCPPTWFAQAGLRVRVGHSHRPARPFPPLFASASASPGRPGAGPRRPFAVPDAGRWCVRPASGPRARGSAASRPGRLFRPRRWPWRAG